MFIDGDMHAVVGDLGLVREVSEVEEGKSCFVSERKSAPYPLDVAPEAIGRSSQQAEYSFASDVFSFGLTLFEMATECQHSALFTWNTSSKSGQQSFASLGEAAKLGYPTLVSKLPAWLSAEALELMLSCLAFDVEKRSDMSSIVKRLNRRQRKNTIHTRPLGDTHGNICHNSYTPVSD